MAVAAETEFGVTEFKPRCLGLIHDVTQEPTELWGALRGSVTVAPGTDLTAGAGAAWEAEG
jgi:hypothetical protein